MLVDLGNRAMKGRRDISQDEGINLMWMQLFRAWGQFLKEIAIYNK